MGAQTLTFEVTRPTIWTSGCFLVMSGLFRKIRVKHWCRDRQGVLAPFYSARAWISQRLHPISCSTNRIPQCWGQTTHCPRHLPNQTRCYPVAQMWLRPRLKVILTPSNHSVKAWLNLGWGKVTPSSFYNMHLGSVDPGKVLVPAITGRLVIYTGF